MPAIPVSLLVSLFIAGATVLIYAMAYMPANCDIGWLTYATESWLSGDVLYHDVFEVNPPLVFYLMLPGVWLATVFSADPIVSYKFSVGLFALAMLAFSAGLLKSLLKKPTILDKVIIAFAGLLYAFIIPGNTDVYAQREHIFMLAILPYLIISSPVAECRLSKATRIAAALLAGIGMCLKPHFFLVWLVVELFHLIRRRSLTERLIFIVTMPFCGLLYTILVAVFHPEYFTELAPIAARSYGEHRFPIQYVWLKMQVALAPWAFLITIMGGAFRKKNAIHHYYSLSLIFAACLLVISQLKGWNYTYLPLLSITLLYLAYVIADNKRYMLRKPAITQLCWLLILLSSIAILLYLLVFEPYHEWRFWLSPVIFFIFVLFALRFHYAMFYSYSPGNAAMFGPAVTLLATLLVVYPIFRAASYFWLLLPWWYSAFMVLLMAFMLHTYRIAGAWRKQHLLYNRGAHGWIALTMIVFLCYSHVTYYRASQDVYTSKLMTTLVEEVRKVPDTKTIYLFNIGIYPGFPLNNLVKKNWSGRFHQLWMIPAAYNDPEHCAFTKRGEEIMEWTVSRMMEDFRNEPPDLVFIDESDAHFFKIQERFDFRKCLSYFPAFAEWFSGYEQINFIDLCTVTNKSYECRYSVWRRKPIY